MTVAAPRPDDAERAVRLASRGDCAGEWDADRLAQLASNLVTNALTYSPPRSTVQIELDGDDAQAVVLSVHNEGEPIPAATLPVLFDPFRRGPNDAPARRGSAGLGLYIACAIVRAHGGRIDVQSDAERGTTFAVRLPRTPPREGARPLAG